MNLVLAAGWAGCVPASIIFGFWRSVGFVSLASIYANAVSHWAAVRADSPNPHDLDKDGV